MPYQQIRDEAARLALRCAEKWEKFAEEVRKAGDDLQRHPDQPEPGFYKMSWQWPEKWGRPIDVYNSGSLNPTPVMGWPWEQLWFSNGKTIKRLRLPVQGYDDPPAKALPSTNVINRSQH